MLKFVGLVLALGGLFGAIVTYDHSTNRYLILWMVVYLSGMILLAIGIAKKGKSQKYKDDDSDIFQ